MRTIKHISPSSLSKFETDTDTFYLNAMAEPKPPRSPQQGPASVGSAFDAYVKSELINRLTGIDTFESLFETQVEKQHQDFAREAGKWVMDSYVHSGAFGELWEMLEGCKGEPQFEFDAGTEIDGIPIFGKPDCRFVHRGGAHVILDWKVNGYMTNTAVSPKKGFAIVRDGLGWPKPSRNDGKSHTLYKPKEFLGLQVNEFFMEQISIDWADQIAMYGWMMGEPIGSEELVVCIDQVVGKAAKDGDKKGLAAGKPQLRFASHRNRISAAHQHGLVSRLKIMWKAAQSGHVFLNLDRKANDAQCEKLDQQATSMVPDGSTHGDFFARCSAGGGSFYKGR